MTCAPSWIAQVDRPGDRDLPDPHHALDGPDRHQPRPGGGAGDHEAVERHEHAGGPGAVPGVERLGQGVGRVVVVVDHVEAGHEGDADQLDVRGDARVGLRDDDVLAAARPAALLGEGPRRRHVHVLDGPVRGGLESGLGCDGAAGREARQPLTREHLGGRVVLGEEGGRQVGLGADEVEPVRQGIAGGEARVGPRRDERPVEEVEEQHLRVRRRQRGDPRRHARQHPFDRGAHGGRVLAGTKLEGEAGRQRIVALGPGHRGGTHLGQDRGVVVGHRAHLQPRQAPVALRSWRPFHSTTAECLSTLASGIGAVEVVNRGRTGPRHGSLTPVSAQISGPCRRSVSSGPGS